MTTEDERIRSIHQTRTFLEALLNPAQSPGVPKLIRESARRCLRHYPGQVEFAMYFQCDPEAISLCTACSCMTKTVERCGKCGGKKP